MPTTYSIVAPIFNELDNLAELYRRVNEVMSKLEGTWELILVDDGSTDGSTERILEMAKQDKHIKPVIFARNFGHEAAITAGWDNAGGDAVSTLCELNGKGKPGSKR
jgi:glycosyltransferase involved in cell wall biosynthesis